MVDFIKRKIRENDTEALNKELGIMQRVLKEARIQLKEENIESRKKRVQESINHITSRIRSFIRLYTEE